ncbi:MAG: tol-pal system protein, partial [Shimia sp.]
MKRLLITTSAVWLTLGGAGHAQDATLADIRTELGQLAGNIATLEAELQTSTTPDTIGGTSVLDRVDALESRLAELTAQAEALDFRIRQITRDAEARIGDLQFRLTELEGGDITALTPIAPLGGATEAPQAPPAPSQALTITEQDQFRAAQTAFDAGDFATAADGFAQF